MLKNQRGPKNQRGVTFLGWVLLLIPVGVIVYAGIRVTPIYLNYFHVVKALQQQSSESKGEGTINPADVRMSLEKRFDIEYVSNPSAKDIDVHRDGDHWVAVANYEEVAPLFGNVSLLMQFNTQVDLK
jgi:Domain of unknown function (DUF4845)